MKKSEINKAIEAAQEKEITEKEAAEFLSNKGYSVEKPKPGAPGKKYKFNKTKFNGKNFSVGSISCTHLSSNYQQLTALRDYYKLLADRGIDTVLHTGDVNDGEKIYRGQEYEVHKHGADAQRDYATDTYPYEKGVKTYMISGNHDLSFYKTSGYDIVSEIAKEREDIEYLGAYSADVEIMGVIIGLMHGAGGNAYARSYKMQKIIEQFTPKSKPDVLLLGHYHCNCLLPEYRNVVGLQLGCFQGQTDYLKRKGLYPEVGGWILHFTVNNRGRKGNKVSVGFEYVPFYKMKERDYR